MSRFEGGGSCDFQPYLAFGLLVLSRENFVLYGRGLIMCCLSTASCTNQAAYLALFFKACGEGDVTLCQSEDCHAIVANYCRLFA